MFPLQVTRFASAAVLLLCGARAALADWPASALANLPICTAANHQLLPRVVSDGAGGAIIVWYDGRAANVYDIYAQRVLANGAVDPTWPVNGLPVCTAPGNQFVPSILGDGTGGVLVGWSDFRGATADVYAHRVLVSGGVDPGWPADGRAVCTATGAQNGVSLEPDGAGGAILTWRDLRAGTTQDVYAHHLLANGEVDPAWPADGRLLMSQPNTFTRPITPRAVSDGAGGVLVVWEDFQGTAIAKVRAQRARGDGTLHPAWPAAGLLVCAAADSQQTPVIASDGASGAYVAWRDFRAGATSKVYLHHVRADGSLDPAWPADGKLVCGAVGMQQATWLMADGAGGVFIIWNDSRAGSIPDLYAHHVLASGALDPGWPVNGLAVCLASGTPSTSALVPDGTGGFLLAWSDDRAGGGNRNIYAHHVLASGAVDPQWPADGAALCSAVGSQQAPSMLMDGSGGLIVAWMDDRAGGGINDIYAQRVQANGQLGGTVVDVPPLAPLGLALGAVHPNPWRGGELNASVTLVEGQAASLELFDVTGRRIAGEPLEAGEARSLRIVLDPARSPSPGIYHLRLRQGGAVRSRRVVVLD